MLRLLYSQDETTARYLPFHPCVGYNPVLLTGNLTGTPTHFSTQSRTLVNETPLQEPLGGRPRTAMDSRCRVPPSTLLVFLRPPMSIPSSKNLSDGHRNPPDSAVVNQLGHIVAITSSSWYEPPGIISSNTPICPIISVGRYATILPLHSRNW
jgi:hypothetical protein